MSEQDATRVTGAQSLIRSLEAAGTTDIFGIPGGAILPAYDPLMDSSIRHILAKHEAFGIHFELATQLWREYEVMRELPMPESLFGAPYLCMHRGDLERRRVSRFARRRHVHTRPCRGRGCRA